MCYSRSCHGVLPRRGGSLWLLLAIAILVVYIVLGILYESYIHPLTILSGLPSAGFGALLTLYLFHIELSIYAFVGLIMLIGIVKKNAIMQIDFALSAERNEGKSPRDAIYAGCLIRFRPIMMTTMAALLGAVPIALGYGAGGEARQPLGMAVVGGLLFVVPDAGRVYVSGGFDEPCGQAKRRLCAGCGRAGRGSHGALSAAVAGYRSRGGRAGVHGASRNRVYTHSNRGRARVLRRQSTAKMKSGRLKNPATRSTQRSGLLWIACALAAIEIMPAQAQTASEITLHNFGRPSLRGAHPSAGIVRDSAGNLYGTASGGGPWGAGVVYKLDTAGHETVLHSFSGNPDGAGRGRVRGHAVCRRGYREISARWRHTGPGPALLHHRIAAEDRAGYGTRRRQESRLVIYVQR